MFMFGSNERLLLLKMSRPHTFFRLRLSCFRRLLYIVAVSCGIQAFISSCIFRYSPSFSS